MDGIQKFRLFAVIIFFSIVIKGTSQFTFHFDKEGLSHCNGKNLFEDNFISVEDFSKSHNLFCKVRKKSRYVYYKDRKIKKQRCFHDYDNGLVEIIGIRKIEHSCVGKYLYLGFRKSRKRDQDLELVIDNFTITPNSSFDDILESPLAIYMDNYIYNKKVPLGYRIQLYYAGYSFNFKFKNTSEGKKIYRVSIFKTE